ncbi:hypothetical protein GCM10009639_70010 [Kitasatospora putterlickiae]|uniref:Uncharacterized protein n=1 Tax=Kitasatospora putterlickiae TaxID=221725 RepID=A0ABN1YJN5_9ACTN
MTDMKKIAIRKAGSVRLTSGASLYGGGPCAPTWPPVVLPA